MSENIQPDERIAAALWVGSPQSVSEYSTLYQRLISQTKHLTISPSPIVVFEDVMMPIEDLIEAFTRDEDFVGPVVSQARLKGIGDASMGVLLFTPEGSLPGEGSAPDGELTYLGTFEFPTDDIPSN